MNSRKICIMPVRIAKYWEEYRFHEAIEYDKIVILSSIESAQKNRQWYRT